MISLQPVILIVDDSDEDRATFRRYLERAGPDGYRCHEASTAAEGRELCRVLHPDAILLDYSLPDDDGLEFLAALIAEHGPLACAVVMLTGAGNATVAVQALKLGAQGYLVKAHDIRQRVILALNGAIEKVQLQRQVEQQRRDLAASNQQLEQALQAQQASAAQLQLGLQAASMATWDWDLATNAVHWGEGLAEMLGLPAGAFGNSFAAFRSLVHPDDIAHVQQSLRRAMQGEQPYDVEFRMCRPDGSVRWTATRGRVLRDAQGTPVRMIGVDMDVTARKQVELALRLSEERLRFLANASQKLLSSLDYQFTLTQLARLVLPYLGDACIIDLADEHAISDMVVAHIDPQHEALLYEIRRAYPPQLDGTHPAAQVLRSGKPLMIDHVSQELLTQNIADDRQRMLVERLLPHSFMMVPLLLRGQTLGVIAVYATAAPRRYAADDLALLEELARRASIALDNARLYQETQEAVREREAFMAIASHELKNPLTVLLGRAQLLQRRLMRQGGAARDLDDIKSVITSTQQMNQLLVDLLDVAHVAGEQLNLNRASLDLGALVRRVASTMEESAPRHQISISAPQEPLVIAGDCIRLEQVFHNLLNNAIKYSPGGGKVAISIAVEETHALITVHDEGLGIPAAALPHLFKRFYRAPSSMSQQIGGTGIGLYVVKEIVTNHGGTVEVSSTEGLGSSFTVYLPLELNQAEVAA